MVVIVSSIKGNETRCTEFQIQLKSIIRANAWLLPTNNQLLMQQILWGVLSTLIYMLRKLSVIMESSVYLLYYVSQLQTNCLTIMQSPHKS